MPHGRGGSRQAVLEAAEDLEVAEGSFAYRSDLLTSAGRAPVRSTCIHFLH